LTCRSFARGELAELDLVAQQQRLRGIVEQAEEIAGIVARVNGVAVSEQDDGPASL
jgi:hypothetical protein